MAKNGNSKCVVILGMHRSGTSALTRVISLLGCDLPKTIMGAGRGNETGHWESVEMAVLNDEILASAGSFWNDWTACPENWFDSPLADSFLERANEVFDSEYGNSRFMVMKDPRVCRIFPFWQKLLNNRAIETSIIFPLRNPAEVAQSLTDRDGSDWNYGLLLWLRYVLDAEKFSRNSKRVFTTYTDLLDNWSGVAKKCEEILDIKWPRMSVNVCEEIDNYLSKKHKHAQSSDEAIINNMRIHSWVSDTYQILKNWCVNGENAADYNSLDEMRDNLNASTSLFAGLISNSIKNTSEIGRLKGEIAVTNTEKHNLISEHERNLHEIRTHNENLQTELQNVSYQLNVKDAIIVERDAHLQEAISKNGNLQTELQDFITKLGENEEFISQIQSEKAVIIDERNKFEEALNKQDLKIVMLEENINNFAKENDELKSIIINTEERQHFLESALKQKSAELSDTQLSLENALEVEALLAKKISDYEGQIAGLEDRLSEISNQVSHTEKLNSDLSAEISGLKQKISESERSKHEVINRLIEVQNLLDIAQSNFVKANQSSLDLIEQITHEERPYLSLKRSSTKRKANLLRNAGVVDEDWYLQQYPDVAATGMNATLHYVIHGKKEGRKPRP